MKYLKLIYEYNYGSPLKRDGGDWNDDKYGLLNLNEIPISNSLKSELMEYQKWPDYTFRIINNIRGGDWNYHTNDEFEKSRIELGIPNFPTFAEAQIIANALIGKLKKELPQNEYTVRPI